MAPDWGFSPSSGADEGAMRRVLDVSSTSYPSSSFEASSPDADAAGGLDARARLAERHLIMRDYAAAQRVALKSLEKAAPAELASSGATRLAYVLAQAMFELRDIGKAEGVLRRVYGAFGVIPDGVALLFVALLAEGGEADAAASVAGKFLTIHKHRALEIEGGSLLRLYLVDVLCDRRGDPDAAEAWLGDHIPSGGDDAKALLARIRDARKSIEAAPQGKEAAAESLAGEGEGAVGGAAAFAAEGAAAGVYRDDAGGFMADAAAGLDRLTDALGSPSAAQIAGVALLGSVFLYSLWRERRTLFRGLGL